MNQSIKFSDQVISVAITLTVAAVSHAFAGALVLRFYSAYFVAHSYGAAIVSAFERRYPQADAVNTAILHVIGTS